MCTYLEAIPQYYREILTCQIRTDADANIAAVAGVGVLFSLVGVGNSPNLTTGGDVS